MGDAVNIGSRRQLFLDDFILERRDNAARTSHEARKSAQPVIWPDQPWERGDWGAYIERSSILFDPDQQVYRMWYLVSKTFRPEPLKSRRSTDRTGRRALPGTGDRGQRREEAIWCCAVSKDLVRWEKPALGMVEHEGSKQNNIMAAHGGPNCIWPTTSPGVMEMEEPDRAKRFKCLVRADIYGEPALSPLGLTVIPVYSADGLHWTRDENHPTNIQGVDDNQSPIRDPYTGQYLWVRRVWSDESVWVGRRTIGIARSRDFIHWNPTSEVILAPDERDDDAARALGADHAQLYSMHLWPYEGVYLGFPEFFAVWRPHQPEVGKFGGTPGAIELQLAYSRDGIRWNRSFDREPLISRGVDGRWDMGMIYGVAQPQVSGDEILFFYNGFRDFHGGPLDWRQASVPPFEWDAWPAGRAAGIGLARLRLDGFISLDAPCNGGVLTTKPLVFAGRELELNVSARRGSVAVEIQDAEGRPVPGHTVADCDNFRGDAAHHRVTWKGKADVSRLAGRPVRLLFVMRRASLYAFQCVKAVT